MWAGWPLLESNGGSDNLASHPTTARREPVAVAALENELASWFESIQFSHYDDPAVAREIYDGLIRAVKGYLDATSKEKIQLLVAERRTCLDLRKDLFRRVETLRDRFYGHGSPAALRMSQREKKV